MLSIDACYVLSIVRVGKTSLVKGFMLSVRITGHVIAKSPYMLST